MADKNAMKNKSAMRNKSKVKNKDIAKNKAAGKKKYAVDKTMKQEAEKRTAGKMGKKKYAVDKTVKQELLKAAISKSAMQVRKSRKSLLRRINVSRRSSKSNIHKITRIISTAGVYPLIKKALDNILGCRFIISFPCNQIKSNLAEQKLYHNMGKMSRDRTC